MVRGLITAGVAALVAVPLAWAIGPAGNVATATLADRAAGARSGAVTIRLHAELQCGRLSARTVAISFPTQMTVPRAIPAAAVRAGGRPVARVQVTGSSVTVTLPPPKGVICDVIGPGTFAISFAARAGLRNPHAAGSYAFSVAASPRVARWHGTLSIG